MWVVEFKGNTAPYDNSEWEVYSKEFETEGEAYAHLVMREFHNQYFIRRVVKKEDS